MRRLRDRLARGTGAGVLSGLLDGPFVLLDVRRTSGRGTRGMSQPARTQRSSVLIVEDDHWMRQLTRDLLIDEGFEVLSAPEGQAGLDLAQRARPTVILLDLSMPRLTGVEFLQRIRQSPTMRDIPVIVVSGETQLLAPTVRLQADAVLAKPLDVGELITHVHRASALGRRGLRPAVVT
jgi:CheY-like chemotaxis protein